MRTVQQVTAAQFAQWRDAQAPRQPLVLDVREPWEVQTASVRPDGFELRVIAMGEIPSQLAQLPKDRPIACLCRATQPAAAMPVTPLSIRIGTLD